MSAVRAQLLAFQFPSDADGTQLSRKPKIKIGTLKSNHGFQQWKTQQHKHLHVSVRNVDSDDDNQSAASSNHGDGDDDLMAAIMTDVSPTNKEEGEDEVDLMNATVTRKPALLEETAKPATVAAIKAGPRIVAISAPEGHKDRDNKNTNNNNKSGTFNDDGAPNNSLVQIPLPDDEAALLLAGSPGSNGALSDSDFCYAAALIFLAYAKCGGSEASFLLSNAGAPVVMASPYTTEGGENKATKQFPDVVSEIKAIYTRENSDSASRESLEMRMMLVRIMEEVKMDKNSSEPLLGNTAVISQATLEMLGSKALLNAFDIVWVVGAPLLEQIDAAAHLLDGDLSNLNDNTYLKRNSSNNNRKKKNNDSHGNNPAKITFPRRVFEALSRRDKHESVTNKSTAAASAGTAKASEDDNSAPNQKQQKQLEERRDLPPIKCRVAEVSLLYNGENYFERSASNWMQVLRNAAAFVFEKLVDESISASSAAATAPGAAAAAVAAAGRDASSSLKLPMWGASRVSSSVSSSTLAEIDVLDEEMAFRLQTQWQPPAMSKNTYNTTSYQIFDRVVETGMVNPAMHIAVIEPRTNRTVTYAELQKASQLVAIYLHRLYGEESADLFGSDNATVALYLPRCADFYKLMLGCHRAGAAYLSLDPDYPADRLQMILDDSGAMAVFTYTDMADKLRQFDYKGKILLLDQIWPEILSEENEAFIEDFVSPTTPRTPAYYIFTSGSTGRPKGVCIEHVNLCTFVLSEVKVFGLSNRHRVVQGFSTSFDASVEEIWLAFASGSALVVVEKSIMQDSDALSSLIGKYKVTVFSTVPSLLAMMDAKRVPHVELVISGAEALNKEVVEAWAPISEKERLSAEDFIERHPEESKKIFNRDVMQLLNMSKRRRFANSYGPTEATVACMVDMITRPLFYKGQSRKAVTIGRAQPNYVAYVVDEKMQLVPPGVPGELLMAGPAVARGYVGERLVALTNEKFLPCPFHDRFKRMYRTGDLVRWSTDGKMLFLGRIDSQVKLRGFRIETGEIETQLSTFPGIITATVVLRTDQGGEPYLCAYVVCTDALKANFSETAMRRHLAATLPKYMIPSRFAWVTEMPRTPAGKLNRKGFAPPPPPVMEQFDAAGDGTKAAIVPPQTINELLLFPIWKELVKVKSVHDNFFEIGGHSLLAGKLASLIRKKGFDNCNISFIFQYPTIAKLAEALPEREHCAEAEIELAPLEFEPSYLRKFLFLVWQLFVMVLVYLLSPIFIITMLSLYGYTAQFETVVSKAKIGDVSTWDVSGFVLESLVLGCLIAAASFVHLFIICPVFKWLLLCRVDEGTYSIWSIYFLRWWTVRTINNLAPIWFLQGTMFLNLALQMQGAKIGSGVIYCAPNIGDADLLEIGDDSVIGLESALVTSQVIDSRLVLRKVVIGSTSSIGARCVVEGGAHIGDECIIAHLSLVRANDVVPNGQRWGGSPATAASASTAPSLEIVAKLANLELPELEEGETRPASLRPSFLFSFCLSTVYIVLYVLLISLTFAPLFAAFLTMWEYHDSFYVENKIWRTFILIFPAIPVGMFCFLFYLFVVIVVMRWVLIPWKVEPAYYGADSYVFHAYFMFSMLHRLALLFSHPSFGSIFTQWYLKALGVEVGENIESSNLFGFMPGLLKLESETFIADFVGVGCPEIYRGIMKLGRVTIGRRAFAGNGAVVHGGTKLMPDSLLGLMSVSRGDVPANSTYIGSPAYRMERKALPVDETDVTRFSPTCCLKFRRFLWELVRTIAPASALTMSFLLSFIVARLIIRDIASLKDFLLVALVFVWTGVAASMSILFIIKWIVVGAERPAANPLYSSGVWRGEFVVDCINILGGGGFLLFARGTPLIPMLFWLLGAKIGKDCYIDTILITEPSLVDIGDNVCIGDRVTLQTHLFEDRVQKLGALKIHDRATIGPLSVVLYATEIGKGVILSPLGLVMKGESFADGTEWVGIPAQRDGRTSAENARIVALGERRPPPPPAAAAADGGGAVSAHAAGDASLDASAGSAAVLPVSPGGNASLATSPQQMELLVRSQSLSTSSWRDPRQQSMRAHLIHAHGPDLGASGAAHTNNMRSFADFGNMSMRARSMSVVAWGGEQIEIGGLGRSNNDANYFGMMQQSGSFVHPAGGHEEPAKRLSLSLQDYGLFERMPSEDRQAAAAAGSLASPISMNVVAVKSHSDERNPLLSHAAGSQSNIFQQQQQPDGSMSPMSPMSPTSRPANLKTWLLGIAQPPMQGMQVPSALQLNDGYHSQSTSDRPGSRARFVTVHTDSGSFHSDTAAAENAAAAAAGPWSASSSPRTTSRSELRTQQPLQPRREESDRQLFQPNPISEAATKGRGDDVGVAGDSSNQRLSINSDDANRREMASTQLPALSLTRRRASTQPATSPRADLNVDESSGHVEEMQAVEDAASSQNGVFGPMDSSLNKDLGSTHQMPADNPFGIPVPPPPNTQSHRPASASFF